MTSTKKLKVDLCIIGAGAGGLSVAAAASQMGVSVALVEQGKMGGDCLNYGCVPSKSLLAAAKTDYHAIPWVTYTMPELAHVGLSTEDALKKDPTIKILTFAFNDNDRAQTENATIGAIKIVTTKKGKILGATILGSHAGELLLPWIIAIQQGRTIRDFTDAIAPYPTLSEISKRVAGEFYAPMLFSDRIKKLVRFLKYFG